MVATSVCFDMPGAQFLQYLSERRIINLFSLIKKRKFWEVSSSTQDLRIKVRTQVFLCERMMFWHLVAMTKYCHRPPRPPSVSLGQRGHFLATGHPCMIPFLMTEAQITKPVATLSEDTSCQEPQGEVESWNWWSLKGKLQEAASESEKRPECWSHWGHPDPPQSWQWAHTPRGSERSKLSCAGAVATRGLAVCDCGFPICHGLKNMAGGTPGASVSKLNTCHETVPCGSSDPLWERTRQNPYF